MPSSRLRTEADAKRIIRVGVLAVGIIGATPIRGGAGLRRGFAAGEAEATSAPDTCNFM
jgi:hypothetical protein